MKSWDDFFEQEQQQPYFIDLMAFVQDAYAHHVVYPPKDQLFSCFTLCPLEHLRVVLLGQDPYIRARQAHGLCFSINRGVKLPPSLRNIYKELEADLGIPTPSHGNLVEWAQQGILMMNAVMSVEEGKTGSHRGKGWETFTDHAIAFASEHAKPSVFVLWGNWAQKKQSLIDQNKHQILCSAHPSPLSAYHGFFGSRPFSKINASLRSLGREEIDWRLSQ